MSNYSDDVLPPPGRRKAGNGGNNSSMLPPPSKKNDQDNNNQSVLPPPYMRTALNSTDNNASNAGGMPLPPPKNSPMLQGLEGVLVKMQAAIVEFYEGIRKEDKITKEVLSVALQLWWDSGLVALNQKLSELYGTALSCPDYLQGFDRMNEDITIMPKLELTVQAVKNQHLVVETMVKKNTSEYFKGDSGQTKSIKIATGGLKSVKLKGNPYGGSDLFEDQTPPRVSKPKKKSRKNKKKSREGGFDDDSE